MTSFRAVETFMSLKDGLLLSVTIALAAIFIAEQFNWPAMFVALLLGMGLSFAVADTRSSAGVTFASRTILRFGVALLGLRISFADVAAFGWVPAGGIVGIVIVALLSGVLVARMFGRSLSFGFLSAGAVAICGASAALAIAAVLPRKSTRDDDVLLTVVGVTALSTLAMIFYPLLFQLLGLSEFASGYLIGATIHDVAQVVGAGYSVSETVGNTATMAKLQRVALLPIVLVAISLGYRRSAGTRVSLPLFVIAFCGLVLLRQVLALPQAAIDFVASTSNFLLLTAIGAIGLQTSPRAFIATGGARMAVIGTQTVVLLGWALLFAAMLLP